MFDARVRWPLLSWPLLASRIDGSPRNDYGAVRIRAISRASIQRSAMHSSAEAIPAEPIGISRRRGHRPKQGETVLQQWHE